MALADFNSDFSKWSVEKLIDPPSDTHFCDGWFVNHSEKEFASGGELDARGALALEPLRSRSSTGLRLSMPVPSGGVRIMTTLPADIVRARQWRFTLRVRATPIGADYPKLSNMALFKQERRSRKWIGAIAAGRALDHRWRRVTARVSTVQFGLDARYVVSIKFAGRGFVEIDSCQISLGLNDRLRLAVERLIRRWRRLRRRERAEGGGIASQVPSAVKAPSRKLLLESALAMPQALARAPTPEPLLDSVFEAPRPVPKARAREPLLGADAIRGDFADLKGISQVTQESSRLLRFRAVDAQGVLRSYFVHANRQTVALQGTRGPIEMIPASGQSLSVGGSAGTPVHITTAPSPHRCIRLTTEGANDTGMIGVGNRPFDPGSVKNFAPAVEGTARFRGESQGTSLLRWLDQTISAAGREHKTFLYRSHGAGGMPMSRLKAGTRPFRNGLHEIERAVQIARIYKRRLIVRAMTWTHGEADRKLATPLESYYQSLCALRSDYDRLIRELTGQSEPVYLLVDQLAAACSGEGPSQIALAQLQAVETDPFILMSCPKYFLQGDYGYLNAVHLKPLGYDVLGEYHAKVWHDVFVEGQAWQGLRPKSITLAGPDAIDVEFFVPVEPLVLDCEALPKFDEEFGFAYRDDQGGALKPGGVSVLNGTTLRFTTDTDILHHTGRSLRYACAKQAPAAEDRSAVWGNLRDSDARQSIAIPGLPLSNWCVSFVRAF